MTQVKNYTDLIFWQKSHQVVKCILDMMRKFPKTMENQIILKQIFRSSTSVSANIAEGYGRYNGKEYPHFLKNALGSAYENDYWFLLLSDINKNEQQLIAGVKLVNVEVINMVTKAIKTIEQNNHV